MEKDKELLKLKFHYLLFFAGISPMLLFTSTYAKQLGFSALTVGSVFTLMPIVGIVGKLVVGTLADKLQAHKQIVLVLLSISIVSYFSMMYIPPIQNELLSEIYCESSTNISLKVCAMKDLNVEKNACGSEAKKSDYATSTIGCQMQCMLDPDLLKTVCEKLAPHSSKMCEAFHERSAATVAANMSSRISPNEFSNVANGALNLKTNLLTSSVRRIAAQEGTNVCFLFSVLSTEENFKRNLSLASLLGTTYCNQNNSRLAFCRMVCNSPSMTDMATIVGKRYIVQEYQLWVFILLSVFGGVGATVIVNISDTMSFALLGESASEFGKIRLWGSMGWGIFALVSGKLVDEFSEETVTKNYSPAFISTAIFLSLDALVVFSMNTIAKKKAKSIALDVGKILLNVETIIYLCWCITVGACLGLSIGFFFWYIEDLSSCEDKTSIKTMEGMYVILQTFVGEIPFFFINAWICKKLGLVNCMSLVLFLYGAIFYTISSLSNPWYFLPLALINGTAFSTLYSVMTSYANSLSLPGTETTVQSLVGSVYEGLGVSSGNLLAGLMMNNMKGWKVFRIFGIAMFILCVVHCLLHFIISKYSGKRVRSGNKNGSTHPSVEYSKPTEMTTT